MGNIKLTVLQWERLLEYIWDARAAEILQGVKESIIKEVIGTTWDRETRRHRRFDVDTVGINFRTELGRLIRQVIEICPSDEHKEAVRCTTRLLDPINRNEVQYINGKMESTDIPTLDVQLVAIGLHASVKVGNLSTKYRGDKQMAQRCTKITEIHVLAYKGIAGLPAGMPIGQNDFAPLPVSVSPPSNQWPTLEPVSVRKTGNSA